jgi:hypothetical protein
MVNNTMEARMSFYKIERFVTAVVVAVVVLAFAVPLLLSLLPSLAGR